LSGPLARYSHDDHPSGGDDKRDFVFELVDADPARQVVGSVIALAAVARGCCGRVWSGSRRTAAAALAASLAVITLTAIAACSSTQPILSTAPTVLSASSSASARSTSAMPTATSSAQTTHAPKPRTTATATTAPPAPRRTTTSAAPASTTCVASMSNPHPAEYSTTDVIVRTRVAGSSVTATAHYKTTDTSHTGTAASNGVADIPFRISRATIGYTVQVDVTVTGQGTSKSCSTSFTPQ
jgi:hypothetical protein